MIKFRTKVVVPYILEKGNIETPDTTQVIVLAKDSSQDVTRAKGTTPPTDTESGYARQATFLDTDVAAGNHALYVNLGDEDSCQFEKLGEVSTNDLVAGVLSADGTGRALFEADFFDTATLQSKIDEGAFTEGTVDALFATGAIDSDILKSGSITSDRLVNPHAYDAGAPAKGTLRVASDVVEAQTVTIGSDVYEVEVVDTDTTDDTANSDFDNTTDPLTVTGAVTSYSNITFATGKLIRIENEMLRVTAVNGDDVTFSRGVSGTTPATHADANDIIEGDGIDGGSTIAVGLVSTLTPAVFTPALVDDINNDGTENVKATSLQSGNEMLLETADSPGGTVAASADTTALAETLGGANNEWDTAALRSGRVAGSRRMSLITHTLDQTELNLGVARISFPFTVAGFLALVYDANGVLKGDLTNQITATSNRVEIDDTGATDFADTDVIHVLAWN